MRRKTLEQISAQDFAGLQVDMLSKLRNGNITVEQIKWFFNLSFEKREDLLGKKQLLEILMPFEDDQKFVIEPLDGKELLAEASDVFASVGKRFKDWGTDNAIAISTAETQVLAYKQIKNATFLEMFESLGGNESLALTQAQIKRFSKKYAATFFKAGVDHIFLPFKSENDKYFIVSVGKQHLPEGVKPAISLYPIEFNDLWVLNYGNSRVYNHVVIVKAK